MELRNVEVVEETDNHRGEYTLDVKVSVNPPEPDVGLGKTIDDYEVVEIVEIIERKKKNQRHAPDHPVMVRHRADIDG